MKDLFNLCEGWENCRNKELGNLFEQMKNEGRNFKWPPKQKMRELNKICASCNHCLELRNDECPVCGGVVMTTPRFPLPFEFEVPSSTLYFYKCINCKKHLYSFEKIV
jgi:hypothetical protein